MVLPVIVLGQQSGGAGPSTRPGLVRATAVEPTVAGRDAGDQPLVFREVATGRLSEEKGKSLAMGVP